MSRSINKQIYEEAAQWLVELRTAEVDGIARERLDAWFRESPLHIRAYLELSSVWEEGADPDLDRQQSTDALIALARSEANIFTLEKAANFRRPAPDLSRTDSRKPRFWWAASLLVICVVGGATAWLFSRPNTLYATGTGEQRTIRLADGSSLELNSRSRVAVRFSPQERDVDLLEGQALFRVAKDHSRPFVVFSGTTLVRAVGTQFDVYRKEAATTVTVVEGQVAVLTESLGTSYPRGSARLGNAAHSEQAGPVLLAAGEQVTVAPSKPAKPAKADVATATAWTQHELIFDSTSLTDVAQEFNRYNVRQLIVSDENLGNFHVTGVFSSTDPASLLRFLRSQPGIHIQESDKEIRIVKQ